MLGETMELNSDETLLVGHWLVEGKNVVADNVCRRIEWLTESKLEHLAVDLTGWDKLYRDPRDGRLWERIFPQGEMHGGGPPQLRVISSKVAVEKYRIELY